MDYLNSLSEEQKKAVYSQTLSTMVLAGAGTGKTRTLIGRVIYLIKVKKIAPEKILLLAFANKAALEIKERLFEYLDFSVAVKVKVSTFHGLGYFIIQQVNKTKTTLTTLADENKLDAFIKSRFLTACLNNKYLSLYYEWMSVAQYELYAQNNFKYFRTLNDEYVKTRFELCCANVFYQYQIHYIYRANYCHEVYLKPYTPYLSTFYLPCNHLYIELIDLTVEEFNQNTQKQLYLTRIKAWHQQYKTKFKVFFNSGSSCNNYYQFLTYFEKNKVKERKFHRRLGVSSTYYLELISLLQELIKVIKKTEEKIFLETYTDYPKGIIKQLIIPILDSYKDELKAQNCLDFDQMIKLATEYIKGEKFTQLWEYILIDEFQDISKERAELILSIRIKENKTNIFCVGDDWQSIFRFTGSDLRYTTNFEFYFGKANVLALTQTYRFYRSLSEASSRFILQNPAQSKKKLTGRNGVKQPIVLVNESYSIEDILHTIYEQNKTKSNVFILARFTHSLPTDKLIASWNAGFPILSISAHTVHAIKGNEADYVILLDLEEGEYGFPSTKKAFALIEATLPKAESYPFAEERRLFYVALTRAKQKIFLCYNRLNPSSFILEIKKYSEVSLF